MGIVNIDILIASITLPLWSSGFDQLADGRVSPML